MIRRVAVCVAISLSVGLGLFPLATHATTITSTAVIQQLNRTRQQRHLTVLTRNVRLDMAARIRGQALLRAATLSHGPNATSAATILRQVGYQARASAELLAADFDSTEATVYAWGQSITHRSILYGRTYREIGAAVIQAPRGSQIGTFVVVILGQKSGL